MCNRIAVCPSGLKSFNFKVLDEGRLIGAVYKSLRLVGSVPSSVYLICTSAVGHVTVTF